MITLGLSEVQFGIAAADGVMPALMTKIGMTYKDTAKMTQEKAEVTEHFEEGKASPAARLKQKKVPAFTFSIMDPDPQLLADLVGGAVTSSKWGFDGTEIVANRAVRIKPEQGLTFDIPNGDIEATINAEFSKKGITLIEVTVTPMAVTANKAIFAYEAGTLTVDPTTLSFTAAADSTGKTITATSTGNVTYAAADAGADWITVTRSLKVVTVKVLANANSESRTANVTIVADGITAVVPVTQAGV